KRREVDFEKRAELEKAFTGRLGAEGFRPITSTSSKSAINKIELRMNDGYKTKTGDYRYRFIVDSDFTSLRCKRSQRVQACCDVRSIEHRCGGRTFPLPRRQTHGDRIRPLAVFSWSDFLSLQAEGRGSVCDPFYYRAQHYIARRRFRWNSRQFV